MRIFRANSHTGLVAAVFLAVSACGGGGQSEAPSAESSAEGTSESADARAQPDTGVGTQGDEVDYCDSLSAEEIRGAFGGGFVVGGATGQETNCIYDLESPSGAQFEAAQLIAELLPESRFEQTKGQEGRVPFEYLEGLGQEAFIVNEAEVWVLTSSTDLPDWWPEGSRASVRVAAQIVPARGVELPLSKDAVVDGLVDLAGKLTARVEG